MLLDRGLLERHDGGYRVAGDLGTLDVPETLHALIAARLDGLEPEERRLLQDAAVLGKTFAPRGLATLAGVDEEALRPVLRRSRARRCSCWTPTRARPSGASTASSRR